jgi:hypothetical protein
MTCVAKLVTQARAVRTSILALAIDEPGLRVSHSLNAMQAKVEVKSLSGGSGVLVVNRERFVCAELLLQVQMLNPRACT